MSRVLKLAAAIGTLAVLMAGALALQFNRFLDTGIEFAGASAVLDIQPGMPFRRVSAELGERQIISQPTLFRLYARLTGKAARIHAGEYDIESGITPRELLEKFVTGEVRLYSFTIVEGWTFRELLAALAADPVVAKTMEFEDWPALLEFLDISSGHPEGLFLPETYRFPAGTTDVDLLGQSHRLLEKVLAEEWDRRATNLPLTTPYEALVLASIIEKETGLAAERPRIAGVFVRRLLAGMRLGADATIIYGLGPDFDGDLTNRDLRTDTAYNTRTRGGLPPTPIALPGRASINAALNPAPGTEMYFMATGLGDGSHTFTDTKTQHDKAVQEYLDRRRKSGNRQGQ